jgi:hypothetical protein
MMSLITKYCSEPIPWIETRFEHKKNRYHRVIPPEAEGLPRRVECLITSTKGEYTTVVDAQDWVNKIRHYRLCLWTHDRTLKDGSPVREMRVLAHLTSDTGRSNKSLAKIIMGATNRGSVVDHIDGDTFNNTRRNLRVVNNSVNGRNRHVIRSNTGVMGVHLMKNKNVYHATIRGNDGKPLYKRFGFETRASRLTKEEAFAKACDWRRQKEIEHGYLCNEQDRARVQNRSA